MPDPSHDKKFDDLARLVGQSLARKWLQMLNKRNVATALRAHKDCPIPKNRADHGAGEHRVE
jgi:hypothetical protein